VILKQRINLKVASRKGFEPLTPGLGNRCSILLSYRDLLKVAVSIGGDWIERAVMIVLVLGHADFYGGGNRHDWESNAG
jgi:hypothetical protein